MPTRTRACTLPNTRQVMLEGYVGHRERFSKQTEGDDGGEEDFLAAFNSARPAGPA
jgi:hypothetical protein